MTRRIFHILASLVAAVAVHQLAPPPDALRAGLALFVLVGSAWITQALPLPVTALVVPIGAVLLGVLDVRTALTSFAHPIIFLFLGGFALAAALQHQGLDRALALSVLRLARGRRPMAVGLLFVLTAFLSMWISNTATAAMMLPLALGLLGDEHGDRPDRSADSREAAFVLLGVAYSASIGGIGTLVGSPPNAIAAAQAGIGFTAWLRIGLPLVALLLPLMLAVLYLLLRPRLGGTAPVPSAQLEWNRGQKITAFVFAVTAAAWIGSAPIARALGVTIDLDSVIALLAVVALVGTGAISWPEVEQRTHWGVLLLFGGGLALSQVMDVSGASRFLADYLLDALRGAPPWLLLLAVVAFAVFLTELVSNTACAALLVPIFIGVGGSLGLPPPLLASAIAAAASCAFMLPVATPPNAIAYATDEVPQSTMMRCGFVLNLVCIGAIAGVAALVWA
jgi:sodium-dependent dicarboxylate transporter 2/3/5